MGPPEIPVRYELKYLVTEAQVEAVRAALRPFCRLDEHSAAAPDTQYVIQSLYFDTADLALHRAARERHPGRFKLRARGYGERPGDGPVFLEVKERTSCVVRKTRARVPGWAERLCARRAADATPAEDAFRTAMERRQVRPTLLVRYRREAWVSDLHDYARITFDRRVVVQPWSRMDFGHGPAAWLPIDDRVTLGAAPRPVVLELKCTVDVPRWMTRLAQRLALQRVGVSKYCCGVERVWGAGAPRHDLRLCAGGDRP